MKIGVALLGSGLHKPLDSFHDFVEISDWFALPVKPCLGLVSTKIVEPDDDGTYRIKHQMSTNRKGSFRDHFRLFEGQLT